MWNPMDGILIKRIHLKSHRKIKQKIDQKMLQKIPLIISPPTTKINHFYEFSDPELILQ
jgi:hypothetical protein